MTPKIRPSLLLQTAIVTTFLMTLSACSLVSRPSDGSQTSLQSSPRVPAASGATVDASGYLFDPRDESCDGFPALKVQTMPGTCLGLVSSQQMRMPRLIVAVPGSEDFLVTDMGGWTPKIGKLWWMKKKGARFEIVALMDKLDLVHGLAFNERDRYFYVGENSRIFRFRFNADTGAVSGLQTVVANLADVAKHMHPLTHFTFSPLTGDLYLNSGAPTDACFQKDGQYKKRCPEEVQQQMASIQKITRAKLDTVTDTHGLQQGDVEVVAKGLRNSMAMAIHPAGRFLIQGENSRDFPELEEPYEEMNVIRLDRPGVVEHYGWPYCFNNHAVSPEWDPIAVKEPTGDQSPTLTDLKKLHGENPFYCGRQPIEGLKDYQRPLSLIPPHAAPLSAGYYQGSMFSKELGGKLLMSFHGHRTTGQRFVAYPVNAQGLPVLTKPRDEKYRFSLPNGCTNEAPFNPRGGFRQHFARYQEVISGWAPIKGIRPKGAPTGFAVASDGSIFIVEDKNKTIVRLAKSSNAGYRDNCAAGFVANTDTNIPLLAWRNALTGDGAEEKLRRTQYVEITKSLRRDDRCLKCHESLINKDLGETPDAFTTLDFFVRSGWLVPGAPEKSLLYGALTGNGIAPAMPPAGYDSLQDSAEGREALQTLKAWITNLPKDIDSRYAQVKVTKALNIRPVPTTDSKPCGQFKPDDVVYVDPRASSRIRAGGVQWSKVYLVPGHTRLVKGVCAPPIDGVYYAAI